MKDLQRPSQKKKEKKKQERKTDDLMKAMQFKLFFPMQFQYRSRWQADLTDRMGFNLKDK